MPKPTRASASVQGPVASPDRPVNRLQIMQPTQMIAIRDDRSASRAIGMPMVV